MRTASWKVPRGATHTTRFLHVSDDPDDVLGLALQGFLDDSHLRAEDRASLIAPDGEGYGCPVMGIRRVSRQRLEEYFGGDVPPDLDPDQDDLWLVWISRSEMGAGPGLSDAILEGAELRHLSEEAILTRPTNLSGWRNGGRSRPPAGL